MLAYEFTMLETRVRRLGVVLEPSGEATEVEGVLNPASARARDGKLLLFPRVVARGNRSRIGLVEAAGDEATPSFRRLGFALEPHEAYEFRSVAGGYGCEDPRVTFVPVLDAYLMAYTAFGPDGPRIAIAYSHDAYAWERIGLTDFSASGAPTADDKDAAFFPEPVYSPRGVLSLALYHRPMRRWSHANLQKTVPKILGRPAHEREGTRIAYIPLEAVFADRLNLLRVAESVLVLEPGASWGCIKNGAGTPPVRIAEGWLSLFHGVDPLYNDEARLCGMRYSAGVVIHDFEQPHLVRYRSPEPILVPETAEERRGTINNVVFPTGLDVRHGAAARTFDVYYGMADARIGRAQFEVGASSAQEIAREESAA